MIISLSGYSGSGKDTVGKIIQYLTCSIKFPKALPIEERLLGIPDCSGHTVPWEIKKFAGKLKTIASILTGIPKDKFEDQEFKKTELGPEWTTIDYIKRYSEPFPTDDSIPVEITEVNTPMTARDLLQKLGTDGLRTGLHPNVWVNALMADYQPLTSVSFGIMDLGTSMFQIEKMTKPIPIEYPNWIITDCRFPNEAIAIKNNGGITIRVDRPGVGPINDHPSEIGLDDWNFDYKIANVSDLTALTFTVQNILDKCNIK